MATVLDQSVGKVLEKHVVKKGLVTSSANT